MPTPALADPSDLDDLFGAPFTATAVSIASAEVRAQAGWHIAPSVTETFEVESHGGARLLLDTLRLTAVTAVRDVTGDDPVTLTDWRFSRSGILTRKGGCWPCGVLEVDVTHGYDECPPELLPVLAAECRSQGTDRRIRSQTRGPFSESYSDAPSVDPALARYTLPSRP